MTEAGAGYRMGRYEALHPRFWLTWIGLAVWRLMSRLPLPVLAALGTALGEILYRCLAARRRVARRNLQLCFAQAKGDATSVDHERLVRRCFHRTGRSVFDTGVAVWSSRKRLDALVEVEGVEHLKNVRASGHSIILLAPHFVSLAVGVLHWSRHEPCFAMYKAARNPMFHAAYRHACNGEGTGIALLDWIVGSSRPYPLDLVEHRAGLKPAVRRLRQGALFYYLPDQDLGRRQTVFAPFFGVPTSTVTAGSRFAALGNARVVPCITLQKPRGRGYRLIFGAPLENYPGHNIVADASQLNAEIESWVRRYPDQYFWLHKRFKTRPEGEAPLYARRTG